MILSIDTETTGLPRRGMSLTDPDYPRIVELAAVLIEPTQGRELACAHFIIKPDGYEVPQGMVHKIDHSLACSLGVPARVALAAFTNLRRVATVAIAHNAEFDVGIIKSELFRAGGPPELVNEVVCTADLGAPVVNLPPTERMKAAGFNKPKRPKLGELYSFLFGEELIGAHSAAVDARAAARCYLELLRRSA